MASIIKKRVMDDETTDRVSSFDCERDKKNLIYAKLPRHLWNFATVNFFK